MLTCVRYQTDIQDLVGLNTTSKLQLWFFPETVMVRCKVWINKGIFEWI